MEKIKNKGKVLVGVLVAIVLLAAGYIIYDKVINNFSNINVVDAHSYNSSKVKYIGSCSGVNIGDVTVNINLPKIDSTEPNAILLNQQILNDFSELTKINESTGSYYTSVVIDYELTLKDDYLYILVKGTAEHPCGSGFYEEKEYYYNIKKDTIMNGEEAGEEVGNAYSYAGLVKYTGGNICTINDKPIEKVNVNVKIPKLNSTKPNAILLNQQILGDFNDFVNVDKYGTNLSDVVVNYETIKEDDYIYIYVKANAGHPCGSGVYEEKSYIYDSKKDLIVSNNNETTADVVSAYSYDGKVKYTGICTVDDKPIKKVNVKVELPKINSTKSNAILLNQQILNDFSMFVNIDKNGTHLSDVIVGYSKEVKNGYIYITVKGNANFPCGSGYYEEKKYTYDITNDIIVTDKTEADNKVVDAYSYVGQVKFDDSGVCKPLEVSPENVKVNVNVKIPKINSTKPNAILLNQQILNDFNDFVNIDKRGSKLLDVEVSYETVVKGDYIDIIVKESSANPCGSGSYTEKKYTYDMKNDSIVVANTLTDSGVVSAYSYNGQVKYNGICTINDKPIDKVSVDVKIPKINSTKQRALLINQQILDDFSAVINIDKNGTNLKDVVVTYESIIKGDYLYIYVKGTAERPCGSGYHVEQSYYYDMKNDTIMMNKEAFEKAGLTVEDLKDAAGDDTIDFDTCNKNSCGCGLKISNYNLVPYYIPYCV